MRKRRTLRTQPAYGDEVFVGLVILTIFRCAPLRRHSLRRSFLFAGSQSQRRPTLEPSWGQTETSTRRVWNPRTLPIYWRNLRKEFPSRISIYRIDIMYWITIEMIWYSLCSDFGLQYFIIKEHLNFQMNTYWRDVLKNGTIRFCI